MQPQNYTPHALYEGIQMCVLYQSGLSSKQLVAIPKVAQETLEWKILGNFHVAKDCGEVVQDSEGNWDQKVKPDTKATPRGHAWAKGSSKYQWRSRGGDLWKPPVALRPFSLYLYLHLSQDTERPFPKGLPKYSQSRYGRQRGIEWERKGGKRRERCGKGAVREWQKRSCTLACVLQI